MATTKVVEEFNLDAKVTVKNIANWAVGFVRLTDGNGDISIAPNGQIRLTRNEIISQVQSGNKLLVGIDGMGSHATLFIDDAPTRVELDFDSEDGKKKQLCFNDELVSKVFSLKTQAAFEKSFEGYQKLAKKYPELIYPIDGSKSIKEVTNDVMKILHNKIKF